MIPAYLYVQPQGSDLGFSEYGPLGAIVLVLIGAVVALWRREVNNLERERTRSDRLEAALEKLNADTRQRLEAAERKQDEAERRLADAEARQRRR